MRKKLVFLGILLAFFIQFSHSGGPQTGKTGAPGDGLCTQCHSTGNPQGLNGSVSIIGLPATIIGGDSYPITVQVSNPNGISQGAGFQMTALNDANNQFIGTLSAPSAGSKLHSGGGRTYHDHTARKPYAGGVATWSVTWTAPMVGVDTDVSLYAAGNITDMDPGVNTSNDLIVTTSVGGQIIASVPPLMVSIISTNDVTCNGGNNGSATALATGGQAPYNYLWSNGQSGPTATNLTEGTHTVDVTDDLNTMTSVDVILNEPSPTVISLLSKVDVLCFDGSTGSAIVSATGNNGGFTFSWSNGQSGPQLSNVKANLYTVTARDVQGCEEKMDVNIGEPDLIEVDTFVQAPNCFIDTSGTGTVMAIGGLGPYTFSWSDGFKFVGQSSGRNDLGSGKYTIEVMDANNCIVNVSLTVPPSGTLGLTLDSLAHVNCPGDSTGYAKINLTNPANKAILWSTGDTTDTVQDLPGGTYTVLVTDAIGCEDSLTIQILDTAAVIEITTLTVENNLCPDDSSGTISLDAQGGQGSLTYSWDDDSSATRSDRTGLPTGQYNVTIEDSTGCTKDTTVEIKNLDTIPPFLTSSSDTVIVYLDADGNGSFDDDQLKGIVEDNCTEDLSVNGGDVLLDCADLGMPTDHVISAVDASGNLFVDTLVLIAKDTLAPMLECYADTVVQSCDYDYEMPAFSDNCPDATFKVNVGPVPGETFPIGTTTVEYDVTDTDGNITTCSFTVTVESNLALTSTLVSDALCFGDNFEYRFEVSGGMDYIVIINGTDTLTADSSGTYHVISDSAYSIQLFASGCKTSSTIVSPGVTALVVDSTQVTHDNGSGNGTINIFVSGGTPSYNYEWKDMGGNVIGSSDPMIDNLSAGMYTCKITDDNDCMITSDTIVIEPATSTLDLIDLQLNIYPIPSSHLLNIDLRYSFSYEIMNLTGQIVKNGREKILDISQLNDGVFLINIKTEFGTLNRKVIIAK